MSSFSLSEPSPALRWVVGTVPWRWLRWQWFGADHEDGTNMLAKTTECLVASKAKLNEFSMELSISVGKVDFLGNVRSQNILNRLACGPSPFCLAMGFFQRGLPGLWENQVPDTAVRPAMNDLCRNQEEDCLKQERKWKIVWVCFWWQDTEWG